jgi:hypothetical protein
MAGDGFAAFFDLAGRVLGEMVVLWQEKTHPELT